MRPSRRRARPASAGARGRRRRGTRARSQLRDPLPAHQRDEHGGADQRGDDPDLELGRGDHDAADDVRPSAAGSAPAGPSRPAPSAGRGRRSRAPCAARSARRRRSGRRPRSRRRTCSVIDRAPSARVRPMRAPSARPWSSPSASAFSGRASARAISDADEQERPDLDEDLHVAAGQRADHPAPVLVERLGVEQRDAVGEGGQGERHRGAGEREPHRRRAGPPVRAEQVDDDRGDRRAEEREPDVGARLRSGRARRWRSRSPRRRPPRRRGSPGRPAGCG